MPLDYNDPHVIRFLKENYEHEKDQRVGWFQTNKEKLIKHATLRENHKDYRVYDILKARLDISMPMLVRHHESSRINRRKKVDIDGPILGLSWIKKDTCVKPLPLMKEVEAGERRILFGEKPSGGRSQYLKLRKRKIPEEKYNFCETSSNVIGWQWKDSAFKRRPPKYGRCNNILREASRSGPQPDPPHYVPPQ